MYVVQRDCVTVLRKTLGNWSSWREGKRNLRLKKQTLVPVPKKWLSMEYNQCNSPVICIVIKEETKGSPGSSDLDHSV